MEVLSKFNAYSILLDIKNESGNEEVNDHINRIMKENKVSYDTVIFINKHKPMEQLSILNRIHENRRKNPLYKSLVNENATTDNKAIALSSLLTQILINNKKLIEQNRIDDAKSFMEFMNANEISSALYEYFNGNDSKLNEVFDSFRFLLKKLYN